MFLLTPRASLITEIKPLTVASRVQMFLFFYVKRQMNSPDIISLLSSARSHRSPMEEENANFHMRSFHVSFLQFLRFYDCYPWMDCKNNKTFHVL
ncbi:hypothetical protein GDO81_000167 [Engystomops pustulosus]|uniref:Uncharacterized protein n=1 Tax=Engystomops pustulosus TaxID=76066 RepID=A0AAV7D5U4_ENGPU|nr:hypothetical protein GDO81_000167 [Engystomops pustulosus]